MNKPNPIDGGPLYVEQLVRVLDSRVPVSIRPPATGGTQVSLRFNPDRLALFDKISGRSGWNRNQIVDALVDAGVNQLFQGLTMSTASALMHDLLRSSLLQQAAEYSRENAHFIVVDGPNLLSGDESNKRRRRVRELANELQTLSERKTPVMLHEFEAVCSALRQAGFSLPGELVSAIAESYV